MRPTMLTLHAGFRSLRGLGDSEARRRIRLARAQGRDAPLVACSAALFTLAGALAILPIDGTPDFWNAAPTLRRAVDGPLGLELTLGVACALASLIGLLVRDVALSRALARPDGLCRCACCGQSLAGVPAIGARGGVVRCPECGRVAELGDLADRSLDASVRS